MELSRDTHDALKRYLQTCDKQPGLVECEAVLKFENTLGTRLTDSQFNAVFKHLCKSKSFENLSSEKTLRVQYEDILFTIPGSEVIQRYCRKDTISHSEVTSMKKTMDRNRTPPISTDYYFQVNLKKETPLSPKDHERIWNKGQLTGEFFRYRSRSSFSSKDSPFRVDLTIVKSGQTWTTMNDTTYEVEIEYIPKLGTEASNETVSHFCKLMYGILRISLGRVAVLKESAYKDVIRQYLSLLGVQDIDKKRGDILRNPKRNFLSYQPKTLERSNINTGKNAENTVFDDYCVTDKADGERHLMYIDSKGSLYYINDRFNITRVTLNSKILEKYQNTLIDGELITQNKSNMPYNVFMAFDLYFMGGIDKRAMPFLSLDAKVPTRSGQLTNLIDDMKETKIKTKTFFTTELNSERNILNIAFDKIWDNRHGNAYEYKIDGLIFQPMSLHVGANGVNDEVNYTNKHGSNSWSKVFKWKPPDENTIDMLTKYDKFSQTAVNVTCHLYVYDDRSGNKANPIDIVNRGKLTDENYPTEANMFLFDKITLPVENMGMHTLENPPRQISNEDIVEYRFDTEYKTWQPYRIRDDKTQQFKRTKLIKGTANALRTAKNIMHTIEYPVDEAMLKGELVLTDNDMPISGDDDVYSARKMDRENLYSYDMNEFHNKVIKRKFLIDKFGGQSNSLFDMGCGKGGDILKFKSANYNFVLGVDNSEDSIVGARDSAWARYLSNLKQDKWWLRIEQTKNPMVFLQMDATQLWDREYIESIKNKDLKLLTKVFWDDAPPKLTQQLKKYSGRALKGFDVVNCQFALHYFFKNETTLNNFCKNLDTVLKTGGHFIGTCFDGDRVHESFGSEDQLQFKHDDSIIWRIRKNYNDNDPKIGRKIDVYIDSINKETVEYLVHFDVLIDKLKEYGIRPLNGEEMKALKIEENLCYEKESKKYSIGSFKAIFDDNTLTNKNLKRALDVTEGMKKYSFMNNWFVFKKD